MTNGGDAAEQVVRLSLVWFSWISFLARRLDTTLIAVSTPMSSSSVTALLGLDSLIGGSSFLRTCVVLLSSVPTGGKPGL